jgi:protein-S-isoprenylcysteine O-methyltransferase Ste14
MTIAPRDTAGVIAPPPLLFGIPWLVGVVLGWIFPVRLLPSAALPAARAIGNVDALLAIALGVWAARTFRSAATTPNPYRPTTAITAGGPYRYTRNPMYVGMLLLYLALTVIANTPWPLLWLPFVLIAMRRGVIDREERYLEGKFGDEYRAYRARVRRWL